MLGSHTSPSLIEDILLPAYWSPRTTFGTHFQKRITPVADRWKLASRDYRRRILRFLKPERNLPGLRTFKESANGPGIERNAALPKLAAIAGQVALSFRTCLISFRYGQSWLWNGFGCDVGFMVKGSCRQATGGVMGAAWLLAAGKKRRKDPAPKGRFAMSNVADPFGAARGKFRMDRAYTPSRLPPDARR